MFLNAAVLELAMMLQMFFQRMENNGLCLALHPYVDVQGDILLWKHVQGARLYYSTPLQHHKNFETSSSALLSLFSLQLTL
jgi:hypothetical protein